MFVFQDKEKNGYYIGISIDQAKRLKEALSNAIEFLDSATVPKGDQN